jgi:hypothetical protein
MQALEAALRPAWRLHHGRITMIGWEFLNRLLPLDGKHQEAFARGAQKSEPLGVAR